jgi:hypothetical protein
VAFRIGGDVMKRARSTRPRQAVPKGDTPSPVAPSRDAIAARAYELYLARGGADGKDIDDWLKAEQDLRARDSQH